MDVLTFLMHLSHIFAIPRSVTQGWAYVEGAVLSVSHVAYAVGVLPKASGRRSVKATDIRLDPSVIIGEDLPNLLTPRSIRVPATVETLSFDKVKP